MEPYWGQRQSWCLGPSQSCRRQISNKTGSNSRQHTSLRRTFVSICMTVNLFLEFPNHLLLFCRQIDCALTYFCGCYLKDLTHSVSFCIISPSFSLPCLLLPSLAEQRVYRVAICSLRHKVGAQWGQVAAHSHLSLYRFLLWGVFTPVNPSRIQTWHWVKSLSPRYTYGSKEKEKWGFHINPGSPDMHRFKFIDTSLPGPQLGTDSHR